ncbi:hypothetical protein IW148_002796 [Coemansia sp. RSA 1199]|nr:hypothetical protein IW148_002796 [Coemansia sp. RSA 1199]
MSHSNNLDSPERSEQASDASSIVQGLSNTAQTIGGSLQAMQQALVGNMQQAAQMTLSMNKMMEELVKRSVQVSVFAQRSEASRGVGTHLRLAIHNRSPIPLLQTRVKLWFCARQQQEQGSSVQLRVRDVAAKDTTGGFVFGQTDGELLAGLVDEGAPFAQTERTTEVGNGATVETEVAVEVDALVQMNGRIAVEFLSPGTGQILTVSHRFGIHLLQLLDCSFAGKKSALLTPYNELHAITSDPRISIDIARARAAFAVPPADGIEPDCMFVMRSKDNTLALRVICILEDTHDVLCDFVASDPESDLAAMRLQLSEELGKSNNA